MDPLPPQVSDEARLRAVAATGLLDSDPEEEFDRLTRLAAELVGVPFAFVTIVDERRSWWKSRAGTEGPGTGAIPVDESFCQYVVADGRPLVVGDARLDPRTRRNPAVEGMGVVAWAGFPIHAPGGEVLGTFCVVDTRPREWAPQDVAVLEALAAAATTEVRLRAALADAEREHRALAESEARFRDLADAAPVMIWTADADGRADYFNAGWLRFRGRSLEEELGDGWEEAVHPDDRARLRDAWRAAAAARTSFSVEVRIRDASGRDRTVLDTGAPRLSASGRITGWAGSCVDVTERAEAGAREGRRAEQLAALAEAALVINGVDTLSERLEAVTEQAAELIGARQGVTTLTLDGDWSRAITAVHRSGEHAARGDDGEPPDGSGVAALVCETNRSVRLTGAELEEHGRRRGAGGEARLPPMNGWLAAPLTGRDGRNIGLIQLSDRREGDFTAEDEAILVQLAQVASLAVVNAGLHEEEQRARRAIERARARTARLQRVTSDLAGALTVEEVAAIIVQEGMEAFEAETGVIAMRRDDVIEAIHAVGYPEGFADTLARMPLDAPYPLAGVMRSRTPVWLESADDWREHGFAAPRIRPTATAVAPLVRRGEAVGAVAFRFAEEHRTMSPSDRLFLLTLAGQCAQALDRARLYQAEHELAETLQRSLLPERLARSPRLRFAVRYQASSLPGEVGGDWYDALELPGGRIGLMVGDVVGRGPAAAAVMGQLRSALGAIALTASGPAEALDRLAGYAAHLSGAFLTTVAYAELTPETGELRHACAGHPPPLLADGQGGAGFLWEGRGPPLGARVGGYLEAVHRMEPGQTLILYTDGLVERRDRTLDARLDELLETVAGAGARPEIERLADRVVADMTAGATATDDAAVLLARLGPATVTLAVPARPEALSPMRRALRSWLDTWGAGPVAAVDLPLALGEAAANAVEHAHGGGASGEELRVAFGSDPGGDYVLRVSDAGRRRPAEALGDRGRGLALMRNLMDEVTIDAAGDGTTVTMRWGPRSAGGDGTGDGAAPGTPAGEADHAPLARLVVERRDGAAVACVRGEIDLSNAGELGRRLRALVQEGGRVVVDLTAVDYLDSVGLQMLAELEDRPGPDRVELVVPPDGPVGDIVRLAGYEELLRIAPDLEAALTRSAR